MEAVEEIRAGVDYFSASMHIEEGDVVKWREVAMGVLRGIISAGNRVQSTRLYGYEGFLAAGNFVGSSTERVFIQFVGAYAEEAYQSLYHASAHIARIDLQVTVKFTNYVSTIGEQAYESCAILNRGLPKGRKRKLLRYSGDDGGYTFYLGSATSDQRGRLYNKEVQSEDPAFERCWRYEVVFRNEYAVEAGKALRARNNSHIATICDMVAHWYAKRGVSPQWDIRNHLAAMPIVRRDPTDNERHLWWLAKQVRPTVQALCRAGYRDVIESILFGEEGWEFEAPSRKTK